MPNVNGQEYENEIEANRLLLQAVPDDLQLTGTKEAAESWRAARPLHLVARGGLRVLPGLAGVYTGITLLETLSSEDHKPPARRVARPRQDDMGVIAQRNCGQNLDRNSVTLLDSFISDS